MEKFLFVPYFCNSEYRDAAIKTAKNETEKSKINDTYGIYRRFICRPTVNGMIDKYLAEKNPLTVKEGELYDAIMRSLSNRRVNVWVEEHDEECKMPEPKKAVVELVPQQKLEEPVVEQPVETEPVVEEKPVEESPKATTPKKKKSTKKSE